MRNHLYQSAIVAEGFTAGNEGAASDLAGNIYAVDYKKDGTIGRLAPDGHVETFVTLPEGSHGCGTFMGRDGYLYVADYSKHQILAVHLASRKVTVYAHEPLMYQPNDIVGCSDGTFYASDPDWEQSKGQLWHYQTGEWMCLEKDMGTTNGLTLSPDESKLYVNETVQRRIWVYDIEDHSLRNKRLFKSFHEDYMDGMACDCDGNVYVTRFGRGTVVKLSADGQLLREIPLHGKRCTNLTFSGEDGQTIYVTLQEGTLEAFRVDTPGRHWKNLQQVQV